MKWHSKPASFPFPAGRRTTHLAMVLRLLFCVAVPGMAAASDGVCQPERARELLAATVVNSQMTNLNDYPVAIVLDQSTFDFMEARRDGSDIAAWDAATGMRLAFWVESFDRPLGKGLVWVKIPFLAPQGRLQIWLTTGQIPGCPIRRENGYAVFPFFSDVRDLRNWRLDPSLSLSDEATTGPLLTGPPQVIESDGSYNSTPAVAEAANGDWVLSYRKGTGHVESPLVILRRSQDRGRTWSPEVPYFDTSKPDPTLALTPDGKLLLEFVKEDPNGISGAAYSLSADNGLTWGRFSFFENPVSNTSAFPTAFLTIDRIMYAASYGPLADQLDSPFLWLSGDSGVTWSKRSQLRQLDEPSMSETAIARVGPTSLLSISRNDDELTTYGRRSDDMGITWGPLLSYGSQVGALDEPQLIRVHGALLLLGRENLDIRVSPSIVSEPRQLVAFVSYDEGKTFGYGTVLDYTGDAIDGGYCWPLKIHGGRLYVVYYADSHGLRQPDIKSLTVNVTDPRKHSVGSLHLVTQLASTQAFRPLQLNVSCYSLDFRFHSRPSPAGSQFSVRLSAPGADGPEDLVRWELPSTHATDPTSISGFFTNQQFAPMLDSFTYDQSYRVRTLVDETQGVQTPEILDLFGQVLSTQAPQPFANGISVHPSILMIGNNSTLRSTDTLLDFIFVRPVSDVEPEVTVARVR